MAARLPFVGRRFRRELDPEVSARLKALRRKTAEEVGSHLPDESRLLLQDLGIQHERLYAVPTTTGQVSFYLVGSGESPEWGGTTTAELPNGIKWLIAYGHNPVKLVCLRLFGLTADYVVAVEVELRGETCRAIVGDNGLFYEIDGCEPDEVSALILQDQMGGRQRVALHP